MNLSDLSPQARVQYTITPDPLRHIFQVSLRIQGDHPAGVTLQMPNWIAGSYTLREFARHMVSIHARSADADIALTPLTQSSWHSAPFTHELIVTYDVFAHDPSVRSAFLNNESGFFNATAVCLSVADYAHEVHSLTLHRHEWMSDWQVATQLRRSADTAERDFGTYWARDYDELADCPLRMGRFVWIEFDALNVRHRMAISGEFDALDVQRLARDTQAICTAHLQLFAPSSTSADKNAAPFESYLFLLEVRHDDYGGLEHRDSTALVCARDALPCRLDREEPREAYVQLLGLISHEYFHSWNVKRIKPSPFVPYDLSTPADTSLLWFFEGVTSYYDDLMLYRCGLITQSQYFKLLEKNIAQVYNRTGAQRQTVTEAGFYAWTKYYHPTENSPNAHVSYYTKGALIAWCLDLFIRENSCDQASLDDVMRHLWFEFGVDFYEPSHRQRGVTLQDIEAAIARFAEVSPQTLLHHCLSTTQALPLNDLLLSHGLHMKFQANTQIELGAQIKPAPNGWLIERVFNGGIAERAGLAPKDILIALNQYQLDVHPEQALQRHSRGNEVTLIFWRDKVLRRTQFNLPRTQAHSGTYHIEPCNVRTDSGYWPDAL